MGFLIANSSKYTQKESVVEVKWGRPPALEFGFYLSRWKRRVSYRDTLSDCTWTWRSSTYRHASVLLARASQGPCWLLEAPLWLSSKQALTSRSVLDVALPEGRRMVSLDQEDGQGRINGCLAHILAISKCFSFVHSTSDHPHAAPALASVPSHYPDQWTYDHLKKKKSSKTNAPFSYLLTWAVVSITPISHLSC